MPVIEGTLVALIKIMGGKALLVKAGFFIKGLTATTYGPTAMTLAHQALLMFQSYGLIGGVKAVVQMLIILGAYGTAGQAGYHALKALRRWADGDVERGYRHARKALKMGKDVATVVWNGKIPAVAR